MAAASTSRLDAQFSVRDASSVSGNTASGDGGGIGGDGNSTHTYLGGTSSVSGNTATRGGGIYSSGEVTVSGAPTISGNIPDNCYPPGTVTGCIN